MQDEEIREKLEQLRRQKQEQLLEALSGQLFRAKELLSQESRSIEVEEIILKLPSASIIENQFGRVVRNVVTISFEEQGHSRGYCLPGTQWLDYLNSAMLRNLSRQAEFGEIDPSQLVFLDIETTGLAGGTGTYPFLIGLGYFDQDKFSVEQYFMEDFDKERAMLREVAKRVQQCQGIVTYNGRGFDLLILRNRFIINRLVSVWELPEIDLLHLSRRLWKKCLIDCTLLTVEREKLHIARRYDVDGALIPRIYFEFARGRHRERILPVFDHNVQDIVSLAALLLRFAYYYHNPAAEELREPFELVGLARLFEANSLVEQAVDCLERALYHCRDEHLGFLITSQIGKIYKRGQWWEKAEEVWLEQLKNPNLPKPDPYVELAKYYEHRLKDHKRACKIVDQAIEFVEKRREFRLFIETTIEPDKDNIIMQELTYRMDRLRRKMHKHQPD